LLGDGSNAIMRWLITDWAAVLIHSARCYQWRSIWVAW